MDMKVINSMGIPQKIREAHLPVEDPDSKSECKSVRVSSHSEGISLIVALLVNNAKKLSK